jgi:type II secretory pathway component PulJ
LTLATAATIASGPLALAFGAGVAIMAWRTLRNAQKLDKETQNLSRFQEQIDQRRAIQSKKDVVAAPLPIGFAAAKFG